MIRELLCIVTPIGGVDTQKSVSGVTQEAIAFNPNPIKIVWATTTQTYWAFTSKGEGTNSFPDMIQLLYPDFQIFIK